MLLQLFPVIFEVAGRDEKITMVTYIYGVHERLPDQIKKDVSPFSINIQDIVMGTFAKFEERGEIKGKLEGKIEAIQLMHEDGFTVEQIAKTLKESEEFVKKAIDSKEK